MPEPFVHGGLLAVDDAELHESTSPGAIAADQRAVVAEALGYEPGAGVARLSELVCLPGWVVGRRLAELRGEVVRERRAKPPPLVDRVAAYLRRHGRSGAAGIAAGVGAGLPGVGRCLNGRPDLFVVACSVRVGEARWYKRVWALREGS
jgi:hypothetical protein